VLAQISTDLGRVEVTVEAYANATAAASGGGTEDPVRNDGFRFDAAARVLARWKNSSGPDVGLRFAVEKADEMRADLAEASLLILGKAGRLEIGDRQGLPDVLLGYAPNNFTFTGAEFGPASGPSLDPAGGLQGAFVDDETADLLRELAVLGFAATLSEDRSAKALYVSPKWRGWLAGISYAPNASDRRFADLTQIGLTHDTYWRENQLHVGGSATSARAADARASDLYSVNLGATLVLDYDWMFGLGASYDTTSGSESVPLVPRAVAPGWGAVASVNYSRGRWTFGAFAQRASRDSIGNAEVRLTAFEAGASYRIAKTLRLYGAWYDFDIDAARATSAMPSRDGDLLIVGLRATL